MPILMGTEEQRQYWGTGNTRKQTFDFGETGEQAFFISGEQGNRSGNRYPLPERASCMYRLLILSKYVPQTTKEGNIFGCIFAGSVRG